MFRVRTSDDPALSIDHFECEPAIMQLSNGPNPRAPTIKSPSHSRRSRFLRGKPGLQDKNNYQISITICQLKKIKQKQKYSTSSIKNWSQNQNPPQKPKAKRKTKKFLPGRIFPFQNSWHSSFQVQSVFSPLPGQSTMVQHSILLGSSGQYGCDHDVPW